MIRSATPADAAAIAAIYNHYVLHTVVTFEEAPVTPREIGQRMAHVVQAALPWLVHERDGVVEGFAYAGPWNQRSAYRFAVETTIYLHPDNTGRGIGKPLYGALIAALRALRINAAMGGIALPNQASVLLHERLGFRKVAHFAQVGWKFDQWIDVGYWQLMLDRDAASL